MFKNLRKKKKGFTLIELIIVIAIIAILAAISVPSFGKIRESAKSKAELADAKNIANAVTMAIGEGDTNFAGDIEMELVTDALLGSYLQSIPTSSAEGGSFYVTVTSDGTVTVFNSDAANASPIYPAE